MSFKGDTLKGRKVSLYTLGCKLNKSETLGIEAMLKANGAEIVSWGQTSDIVIINTCTVTAKADYQCRQAIRRAKKDNPEAMIVVAGCYSQRKPPALLQMRECDLILGNREKESIIEHLLDKKSPSNKVKISDISEQRNLSALPVSISHQQTRAFLRIQDGCNSECTYCIVPLVRGPSRSLDRAKILESIKEIKNLGYKEIVLTGAHIGEYGKDLNPPLSLSHLLKDILNAVDNIRIRLTSLEPLEFTPDLLSVIQHPNICRHFHIPLQSASDEVLKLMRRPYNFKQYEALIENLRALIPEAFLAADAIVGFPGETEEMFNQTLEAIKKLPLSALHIFPFSPREGTSAFNMEQKIDCQTTKFRAKILRAISKQKKYDFISSFQGKVLSALILNEKDEKTSRFIALTDNYINVLVECGENMVNKLVKVKIEKTTEDKATGIILEAIN